MADWSQNNRAHEATWKALRGLGMMSKKTKFDAAGNVAMTGLRYWINGEVAGDRRDRAAFYAAQMDDVFTQLANATYEATPGTVDAATSKKVREQVTEVLVSPSKTVRQLGVRVDELYRFPTENA